MTDREKLIGLLIDGVQIATINGNIDFPVLADYLRLNGVEMKNSNIGRTVYALCDIRSKRNCLIDCFYHLEGCKGEIGIREKKCTKSDLWKIGKLVFLTREEAEKALAERQGENEKH